ncbi:MAG TPA: hypothetical protein PKH77_26110 [Anaerolineae bacterium]|nr:hypothetical protein [Anaerolineae bacterium]
MTWPKCYDYEWKHRQPLKYRSGAEPVETLVVYAAAVKADANGRRVFAAGTILCEITSGPGIGKYGPYDPTATDGRQTIGAANQPYVAIEGLDVTLGNLPVGGLWAQCVFNTAEIESVNAIPHTELGALKTAFPNAEWK